MTMSEFMEDNKTRDAADCRKRAEECVELAQTARTPQQRTMLLHIAETWLRLAEREMTLVSARSDATLN